MSVHDIPVVLHNDKRGLLSIEEDRLDVLQLSSDGKPPHRLLSAPMRLVLRARLGTAPKADGNTTLDLTALVQKGEKSNHLHLSKIRVLVEPPNVEDAAEWVQLLMKEAYPITKPCRRVLLLINPVGGKGKARTIVKHNVTPILEAAGCQIDIRESTHAGHMEEYTREMDLKYDVIAVASGDGGVFEVLNGLASRPDARKALRTPVGPLPTGSACAACTNIFGPKDTFNVALATLNVIKGQPMGLDLCSILILPSHKRRVSFLSVALGLMVDVDIGTESFRWMGDARFIYGFLRGIVQNKTCKARLCMDVIEDDKLAMAAEARKLAHKERHSWVVGGGQDPLDHIRGVQEISVSARPSTDTDGIRTGTGSSNMSRIGSVSSQTSSINSTSNGAFADAKSTHTVHGSGVELRNGVETGHGVWEDEGPLPEAKELHPTNSWLTIDTTLPRTGVRPAHSKEWSDGDTMMYLYSGLMPWVARDFNQWPVARAGGGEIELVVQRTATRKDLVTNINGAQHGESYWHPTVHYFKVRAYTVDNLDKANQPCFTIDGEPFEWDSFHVELLPMAATMLSLDGRFYHSQFVLGTGTGK